MILKQFYLNCLAHASYVVGDDGAGLAVVVDPQRDIEQYLAFAEANRLRISARRADPPARRLPRRAPRAARSHRRHRVPRRPGQGRVCVPAARRRRHDRARPRAADARSKPRATRPSRSRCWCSTSTSAPTRPHAVLTGDTLFVGDVGRPDLRASLGWSAASLGTPALRLAARQADGAARRQPGLPGARRRIAVRQGARQGDVLDHRRAAAGQLRAAADEPRGVRRAGHRRSARRAGLFRLRRGAERQGASDARPFAGRRA